MVGKDHAHDPGRVLVARLAGHQQRLLGILLGHDDDQGEHTAQGHRPHVLADLDEPADDL